MCMVRVHTWGLSYNQVSSFNHGHSSWFVRIVRILRASMVGEWGSSPQCPQNKKKNMERTLKDRKYSITGLFKHIGAGNKLHVPLSCYTANSVTTECTRQNRYEGCDPMNNKFATTKKEKVGHITIIQRY